MGRIVPPFRQLYQETISDLSPGALVDLGHKSAFDLLLKEAWNPEQAAMGNSTLPTVCDKLNIMASIHLRKLIATLVRENGQRDAIIDKLENTIVSLESRLNEMKKQPHTEVMMRLLAPCHRNSCNHSFNLSCSSKIRAGSWIAVFNWPLTQRHSIARSPSLYPPNIFKSWLMPSGGFQLILCGLLQLSI
jgi:hypothetical protein